MTVYPSSRIQAERTIAAGRVILVAASLFAIWLDPVQPARGARVTYEWLFAYLLYAVVLATATWRWRGGSRLPIVTHVVDLVVFSIFVFFTFSLSSPFFMFLQFSMFCGALRWGPKGTMVTGGVVVGIYALITASMSQLLDPAQNDLNRFVVRIVNLVVTGGMLVYLGRYEARLRSGIERLARWPQPAGKSTERVLSETLQHAVGILAAQRALVIWEGNEEPGVQIASWSRNGLTLARQSTDGMLPILPPELNDKIIVAADSVDADATILVNGQDGKLIERNGLPLSAGALELLQGEGLASSAFQTDTCTGRIFFTGLGTPTAEIVPLTDVVGRAVGWSIEQIQLSYRLQEIGASEERIRLARDLHDGLLQSLTGVRFELRALQDAIEINDESAVGRLHALERALAMEQRELRLFINGLKPAATAPEIDKDSLGARLDDLGQRIALEWKTPVSIRVAPGARTSSAAVAQAVPLMVHEAVVNAMKHARPTRVAVTVDQTDGHLRIVVRDDGCGFDFRGRHDHDTLNQSTGVPRSLFDRVTALGGQMSIDSSAEGSQVEMLL
jgi:signal transduction histidine kinase